MIHHFSGRQNPRATIGFVIMYPFHFFVEKNVYEQMRDDAEFIVDLGAILPAQQPPELLQEIISVLESHNASYRILYPSDYAFKKYLDTFFSKYLALVSLWERGCVAQVCNRRRKKICLTYGAGKELNSVRPARGIYDLILSYGQRDHALFSYYTRSIIVGDPKFDDWFNNNFDATLLSAIRARLDSSKKTILYLPTHSDLSSVDILADELLQLTTNYNVVVKLHYFIPREEPERALRLSNEKFITYTDTIDLLHLLKICDVVLSDNSSAIFDAIHADKSIVVADFWDDNYLSTQHRERIRYRRGYAGAVTYSGSIEQVIKREKKVLTLADPKELQDTIEVALHDNDFFRKNRSDIRRELFAFDDGKSAERAAQAIRSCIADVFPKERPILYHAIEAYKSSVGRMSYARERELNDKITTYESQLSDRILAETYGKIFSIILIRDQAATVETEAESFRALAEQQFPAEKFEIIIVDSPRAQTQEKNAISRDPRLPEDGLPDTVEFPQLPAEILGSHIMRAVQTAKAPIVCFTTSAHRVPSDWLMSFYTAYEKHPTTGGVGGYVRADSEYYSIFDEVFYYDLGKRLGIEKENRFLTKLYEVENQLLYQNPTGNLSNMSYRKESISANLAEIRNILDIEMRLKVNVLKLRPLCFIPKRVTRLSRMTARDFLRMHYERGFAHRLMYEGIAFQWKYRGATLPSAVAEFVHTSFRHNCWLFGPTIFLARLAQWLGNMRASLSLLKRKVELEFRIRTGLRLEK